MNGIRACINKGLLEYLRESDAGIIALQETKVNEPLPELEAALPGYAADWNAGERLGYSGTVCLFRRPPLAVTHGGLGEEPLDGEGRIITLEYPAFYFINVYVPNSQGGLDRWYYRLDWDTAIAGYLEELQQHKPVIVAGDFNVARDYIDIFPENLRNIEKPYGFLSEERDGLNALFDLGLVDVFRELHPTQERAYTWWSSRLNKRRENRGWRIDYVLVSSDLLPMVSSCEIRSDVAGSDHAPIELVIEL